GEDAVDVDHGGGGRRPRYVHPAGGDKTGDHEVRGERDEQQEQEDDGERSANGHRMPPELRLTPLSGPNNRAAYGSSSLGPLGMASPMTKPTTRNTAIAPPAQANRRAVGLTAVSRSCLALMPAMMRPTIAASTGSGFTAVARSASSRA